MNEDDTRNTKVRNTCISICAQYYIDVFLNCTHVYCSNRPFWVKRFQTIHHYSVDVARGLALLFGIGTEALVWGLFCQAVSERGTLS